jgi:hypothetical protein
MTQDWPHRQRFFTFNDTILEAVGIMPNGGRAWIASRHVESGGRMEFYDLDDIFDACVFYSEISEAAKELGK